MGQLQTTGRELTAEAGRAAIAAAAAAETAAETACHAANLALNSDPGSNARQA